MKPRLIHNELDQLQIDLIKLRSRHEDLMDMTMRDPVEVSGIEARIESTKNRIAELQEEY